MPRPTPTPPPPLTGAELARALVDRKVEQLGNARTARQTMDARLGDDLARLAPALTDAERDAYRAAFKEKHKAVYASEADAALALRKHLESNTVLLAKFPEAVRHGYRELASSPQAEAALDWACREKAKSSSSSSDSASVHHADHLEEIASLGAENAAAAIVARSADPKDAVTAIAEKLAPFVKSGMKGAGMKTAVERAMALAGGNFTNMEVLAQEWDNAPPALRALRVVGVVAGIAQAGKLGNKETLGAGIAALAAAGKGGAEIVIAVTRSMAHSGKLIEALGVAGAKQAGRFASMLSNFLPALGVAAAGGSAIDHMQKFLREDGNPGHLVSVAGDVVSLVGAALEATPLAPVGVVVNAAGMLISAVGEILSGIFASNEEADERAAIMRRAGELQGNKLDSKSALKDPALARLLAGSDLGGLQAYGMSREQLVELARRHPEALGYHQYDVLSLARDRRIPPQHLNEFLDKMRQRSFSLSWAFSKLQSGHFSVFYPKSRDSVFRTEFPEAHQFAIQFGGW